MPSSGLEVPSSGSETLLSGSEVLSSGSETLLSGADTETGAWEVVASGGTRFSDNSLQTPTPAIMLHTTSAASIRTDFGASPVGVLSPPDAGLPAFGGAGPMVLPMAACEKAAMEENRSSAFTAMAFIMAASMFDGKGIPNSDGRLRVS